MGVGCNIFVLHVQFAAGADDKDGGLGGELVSEDCFRHEASNKY